jgi:hypothetical protein
MCRLVVREIQKAWNKSLFAKALLKFDKERRLLRFFSIPMNLTSSARLQVV